jgi:hypothetical protein
MSKGMSMPRFVTATDYNNGRTIFMNPDNILFFYLRADNHATVVVFRDNMTLEIEEKPEEFVTVFQDTPQ